MHKKLYLVDQSAVDKLKSLENKEGEGEKPLSYSEIYETIVNCKNQKAEDATPKLEISNWLKYRWHGKKSGKKIGKKTIQPRRTNSIHEHKRTDQHKTI